MPVPNPPIRQSSATADDELLTLAQAAEKLGVSRPYVRMLSNRGVLGEVVSTVNGERRLRSSNVKAYMVARAHEHVGVLSPRQAGIEAGLYARPDDEYKNVARATSNGGIVDESTDDG